MQAYHNNPAIKDSVIATMRSHREADTLIQGYGYWKDGKGCAVGCLIKSANHAEYETRFGIPQLLAKLEDRIFEGLSVKEAREWPERFLGAINPGADLTSVWPKFAVFMLTDKKAGVINFARKEASKKAIQEVSDLYQRAIDGEKIDVNVWLAARQNAAAAAAAAAAAYAYAADDDAADDDAAAAAAAAAAYAAAAAAAAYAAAAYAADAAARKKHFGLLADALIRFLEEAI